MAKTCTRCGELLVDNDTFCMKCGKSVETEEQLAAKAKEEKAKKKKDTIIGLIILAVLIVAVVFLIRSCTNIYKTYSVGEGELELKSANQVGSEVTLYFVVKDEGVQLSDLGDFAEKIKVDGCEYDSTSYEATVAWSSSGGLGNGYINEGSTVEVLFIASSPSYKFSDGDVHMP